MNAEEDNSEAVKVRQALEEFLDRLASAVAGGLDRTKIVDKPCCDRSTKTPKGGPKSPGS